MKRYISGTGEIKSKEEWERWAKRFYRGCESIKLMPNDWWDRIQRVLNLKEI